MLYATLWAPHADLQRVADAIAVALPGVMELRESSFWGPYFLWKGGGQQVRVNGNIADDEGYRLEADVQAEAVLLYSVGLPRSLVSQLAELGDLRRLREESL